MTENPRVSHFHFSHPTLYVEDKAVFFMYRPGLSNGPVKRKTIFHPLYPHP